MKTYERIYQMVTECPKCGGATQVIDTRSNVQLKALKRRRACLKCKYRFTTFEITEEELKELC